MKKALLSLILASIATFTHAQTPKVTKVTTLKDTIHAGSGGMEVDKNGMIYMSNFGMDLGGAGGGGKEVYKMTPAGEASVYAQGLNGASGSDIGPDGLFYQSNIQGGKISVIDAQGNVKDFATEGFFAPVGLVKTENELFVCNCGNGSIQKVDAEGNSTVFAKSALLKCPNGLEMDDEGNLYAANFSGPEIIKIDKEGNASVFATIPGNNNGHLVFREGYFYVVGRGAHKIFLVDKEGTVSLLAGNGTMGNKDGIALEATFRFPNDLAFSPDGSKLYVNDVAAETQNGRLLGPVVIRVIHMQK